MRKIIYKLFVIPLTLLFLICGFCQVSAADQQSLVFTYDGSALKADHSSHTVALTQNNPVTEKMAVVNKSGKNISCTFKVITDPEDSYWKGTNIEIAGLNNTMFDNRITALPDGQTFDMPKSGGVYVTLTAPADKPEAKSYRVKYQMTVKDETGNTSESAITVKYVPSGDRSILYKLSAILSALIIVFLIYRKSAKKHAALTALLILICVFNAFVAAGFRTDFVRENTMAPEITKGSIVVSKKVSPAKIRKGDVIIFNTSERTMQTMEKVKKTAFSSGLVTTKSNEKDAVGTDVKTAQIKSRVVFAIPKVGYAMEFLEGFFRK